jgi:hypothetical protein
MDQLRPTATAHVTPGAHPAKRACLVPGCPCKDARIVSHRRARFFASIARTLGETADRFVAPDPDWRIPAFAG